MTTKELLDEYTRLQKECDDASDHNYWDDTYYKREERKQEIIKELEASIRKEVVTDMADFLGNKDYEELSNKSVFEWCKEYALSVGITLN